jgi:PadR family transcriptional regulator PadR
MPPNNTEPLYSLEEKVLVVVNREKGDAYGISILKALEAAGVGGVSLPAIYKALGRLESKGFVSSQMGDPEAVRGGRSKKLYTITGAGEKALDQARDVIVNLWKKDLEGLPPKSTRPGLVKA